MSGEKGPADIKLSEGVVLLNGFTIPCVQIEHSDSIRKVASAENVIKPPKSEMIINVFVERFKTDSFSDSLEYLIEPNQKFGEKYPLLVANCLVDISSDVANKVRIMNPFDKEINLLQDTVVGMADKVESSQMTTLHH